MSKQAKLIKLPIQELKQIKKDAQVDREAIIKSLLKTLELKDPYTFKHSTRVAYYSLILGKEMGLNETELKNLELAALFHDIGKIGIPDVILNKPYGLDEDEFTLMKKHPEFSYDIIKEIPNFKAVQKGVLHHHERFDGRGYPSKLAGEKIPFLARVISVADSFDAMTSTRTYRKGLPRSVAIEELFKFSDKQFDGNIVKAFIRALRKEEKSPSKYFSLTFLDGDFVIAA